MENNLDLAHLQGWIGRSKTASETVSDALVSRFRATLGQWLADPGADNVPLGLHWCLTQPVAAQTALGPLQATLLLNLAANQTGRAPAQFSYRGVAPLFCGQPVGLHLEAAQNDGSVWLRDNAGQTTMKANYQT